MASHQPEPTAEIRLPASLVRRIRTLAAHQELAAGEYVVDRLGPVVERDEAAMVADMKRERRRAGRVPATGGG